MSIVGKWNVVEVAIGFGDDIVWKKKEDISESDFDNAVDYQDQLQVFNAMYDFQEDHMAVAMLKLGDGISEEDIQAMVSEGAEVKDGFLIMEKKEWKEEDGKYFLKGEDTELEPEVAEALGITPWVDLNLDGDTLELMSFRMKRA